MTYPVALVGAGPGDAGLITVRGRELLEACDAVVFDALANPRLLEYARHAEQHDAGKRGGEKSASQDDINALLIQLARAGKRVVRLKGGDPLVFGRGSEEALALADAGLPFEIVPGVTAGVAAPAYAGIPVTHRGVSTSVTFVTGHEDPSKGRSTTDWDALARGGGTIVLYMGVKSLSGVAKALMAGGREASTPVAAIEWGTYGRQRTVIATLETIADRVAAEGVGAPVISVIGDVVSVRESMRWYDQRPLSGRRLLVSRPADGSRLTRLLEAQGAEVVEINATRIEPMSTSAVTDSLGALDTYQWLVLTSAAAVHRMLAELRSAGRDVRALAHVRIAVVGRSTAEALARVGIVADVIPERFSAEGVLEALANVSMQGTRVLYLAAEGARDVLPDGLRARGATLDFVPLYRTVPECSAQPRMTSAIRAGLDAVMLTAASTVEAIRLAVDSDMLAKLRCISIGPITTGAARSAGLEVIAEAREATLDGLVDAAVAHFGVQA